MMRLIEGYEDYLVGRDGRVYSVKTGHFLNPVKSESSKKRRGKPYLKIELWKDGKFKRFFIHRLVGKAFIPNPGDKPEINHKNNDGCDNRVENLEWVTRSENVRHYNQVILGKPFKGPYKKKARENWKTLKLTEKDVEEIISMRAPGMGESVGRKFGVTGAMIGTIWNNKRWIHIPRPVSQLDQPA